MQRPGQKTIEGMSHADLTKFIHNQLATQNPDKAASYDQVDVHGVLNVKDKLNLSPQAKAGLFSGYVKVTTTPLSGGPPVSPSNGDIWIATGVDSNGTRWQFQYNTGSASAYKWEFIGGPPAFVAVETSETTISTAYVDLTTVGPSFTCSRGGDYLVTLSAVMFNTTAFDGGAMSFDIGATAAIDNNAIFQVNGPANLEVALGGKVSYVSGLAANTVLRSRYRAASGGTATFLYRRMNVLPIRVA